MELGCGKTRREALSILGARADFAEGEGLAYWGR